MEDFLDVILGFATFVILFIIYYWIDDCHRSSKVREFNNAYKEYENLKKNITHSDVDKIKSMHKLTPSTEEDLRRAADDNEWGQMFLQSAHELIEQEKLKEQIAEDFKIAQGELVKMQNIYDKYFDGYNDIRTIMLRSEFDLEPVRQEKLHIDYLALKTLKNDSDTAKSMPAFCGEGSEDYIYEYLINTCLSTKMGIAFAFAIRKCKEFQLRDEADSCYGIIKITCPSHNKVTNNFDGWLVDFVMLPEMRNQGIMKQALNAVLDEVKRLGAKKLYAMVMPDNKASLHVLQHNGFKNAGFGGVDRATGIRSMLVVHEFETTD